MSWRSYLPHALAGGTLSAGSAQAGAWPRLRAASRRSGGWSRARDPLCDLRPRLQRTMAKNVVMSVAAAHTLAIEWSGDQTADLHEQSRWLEGLRGDFSPYVETEGYDRRPHRQRKARTPALLLFRPITGAPTNSQHERDREYAQQNRRKDPGSSVKLRTARDVEANTQSTARPRTLRACPSRRIGARRGWGRCRGMRRCGQGRACGRRRPWV